MQFLIEMKCFVSLTLRQFFNGDTGPAGNNTGYLIIGNYLMNKASVTFLSISLFNFKLLLSFRQPSILQLGSFLQIIILSCNLNLLIHILNLFTKLLKLLYRMLLVLPLSLLGVERILHFRKLLLKLFQTLFT